MTCTIFEDIFATKPNYILVDTALERIKSGKSKFKVEEIRSSISKEKAADLKKSLPSVCFSGKFSERYDKNLIEHSGFLILDFDKVQDLGEMMATLANKPFIYSAWVSPSGNGIKALVRLADGKQHRAHFAALKEMFPDVDNSGVNESRVCFESYDPNIYINKNATPFTKTLVFEKVESREVVSDENKIFQNLLTWIARKGGAFQDGQRNNFIYRLASSMCRYGIDAQSAEYLIINKFPTSNDFTQKECQATIKSAYRSNSSNYGTAQFDFERLVDKKTRREIDLPKDEEIKVDPNDVIYGATVKENALNIFKNGYEKVTGIGLEKLDNLFKLKKGELTCLTGIGNYGKTAWLKWYLLIRILVFGEKFAAFVPEDNPPEEYYHDFVEILLGKNCSDKNFNGTPNLNKPPIAVYENAYDFISRHVFYLYPKTNTPTPEYILEAFLKLIIEEGVSGVITDPWNQLAHSYTNTARSDQYLEVALGNFSRFAQINDVYNIIVAHPTKLAKLANGNYPCPDVFELSGGAMWNNKLENILVYHRPFRQTDAHNPIAELHTKKIKRQKSVGKIGILEMEYRLEKRRFEIDGIDYISDLLGSIDLSFNKPVENFKPIAPPKKTDQQIRYNAGFEGAVQNRYNNAEWSVPTESRETKDEDAPF